MNELARGAAAGLVATLPMTLVFFAGKAAGLVRTPPPREITATAARETEVRDELGEPSFSAAWLAAHFGYGAACGVLYRWTRRALPTRPAVAGLTFGALVWGVSYGLLMPVLGLYPSLRRDSRSRSAVTAAAHAVYGAALAQVDERLAQS